MKEAAAVEVLKWFINESRIGIGLLEGVSKRKR